MGYSVITIGREHGSGGRMVAQKVADRLGIPLYDKKLIRMTADESGFSENYVAAAETKRTSSFLYNLYFDSNNLPLDDQLFLAQCKVIEEAAQKGPCVIVGRCGDYVLREWVSCLRVFLYAPMEERMRRAVQEYHKDEKDVQRYLEKYDKSRATYYNRFTNEKWGDPHRYHLMINTTLGLDVVADQIIELVQKGER